MKPTEPIRVATWNCFGSPFDALSLVTRMPYWPARLESAALAHALGGYDVVCIQENLVHHVRERLERLQRAAAFAHLWFDPLGPDLGSRTLFGGGLAILSRWPLRARFSRLTSGTGPDLFARKGFTVADVDLPSGRAVRIVNTHLQADYHYLPARWCRAVRAAQLAGIVRAVAPRGADGPPLILCGDLNVAHATEEYGDLSGHLGTLLTDVTAQAGLITYDVGRNDIAARFHEGGEERALLDYIWVSPGRFAVHEVKTLLEDPLPDVGPPPRRYSTRPFASDHYAVGATLELLR